VGGWAISALTHHRHHLAVKDQQTGPQLVRIRVQKYYGHDRGVEQCRSRKMTWRRCVFYNVLKAQICVVTIKEAIVEVDKTEGL
jgi:hypothetical protein